MTRLVPVPDNKPLASDLLEGLNERQAEAVRTTEGPVLIIAGAGSGKTRVLTYRIAYLLREGVHPAHILALTFTNKAAQEMRERIDVLVGHGTARAIWAGTFHSVFARMLRPFADKLGYTSSFTVYDADDQLAAVKQVMNQLGVSQQVLPPNGVRSRISHAKNAMVSWQEYQRRADALIEKQSGQIYELYERRLVQSNAMDFDDLLLNMITLLEKHPDVLEHFQDRFRYILVDEYQDTNRAQYKAVTLLASKLRNLCVVGDDAQSIYRWRGADIRNILDFQKDYPEATVVRLEQNYRSTKTILAAADSVIRNNRKQLPKTLWTDNTEGEKITLLACRDDREEAESVVRTIRERLLRANHSWRDAAILYRTNAQSQALEDALRRLNIPYHIVSGVSFYKRKEVKDALAYLRLIVNPSDSESLLRVINEPARGIGATSLERLQEEAARTSQTLYAVMQHADSVATVQKRTATAVKEFVDMIERYRLLMQEMTPASLAQSYIEATGLPKMYRSQDTEESLDRWNNIERLLSHIAEQQELNEELTLTQYLEQISLLSDADDPQLGNDRIALMTMHAAKGLEFPVVAIAGLEQGLFPLAKADQDPGEMEEERRLFYVGITRARNELILSYAERRYRFGELVFARPSTFLSEIDQQCFTASSAVMRSAGSGERAPHTAHGAPRTAHGAPRPAHGAPRTAHGAPPNAHGAPRTAHGAPTRSAAHLPKAPSAGSSAMSQGNEYDQTGDHASGLRVGMRVKHPMFGIGTVSGLSGTGQQAKATVQFITAGRKQLMLAYARLEII